MTTRRQLLQSTLAGAAALAARRTFGEAKAVQKILILGGTGFLGPHLVEAAKARGHALTLFNRGKTNPHLFPEIEKLKGDRKGDLKALEGRKWDAVIDDTAYVPRLVKLSAKILAPNVSYSVLVSSISVFPDDVAPGADESSPVQKLADPNNEEVMKNYGALKAACEKAADESFAGKNLNIRPGLIVGPGDNTDRYTYWPVRIDRGGEALAPGDGKDPVQYIDVRDLAAFIIHCVEERTTGTLNCTGPEKTLTCAAMLEACRGASKNPASLTWVDAAFLKEHKVEPWGDMPVWTGPEAPGFSQLSNARAVKAGLRFRPADETARDTLAWFKTQPEERQKKLRAGITPEREREVLAAWHAKQASK